MTNLPVGADAAEELKLDRQICFQLYALQRAVTALYRPLLDELGLTYPQYLVMLVLWEAEGGAPINVSALGERLALDSGTLTPLLKRLEAQGLLHRQRARHDERVVEIGLSAAGRALRERAVPVPARLLCAAGLSTEEAISLQATLAPFVKRLVFADASSDAGYP